MKRFLRWLIQIEIHTKVAAFAVVCVLVGLWGSQQQADDAARSRMASGGTQYASK